MQVTYKRESAGNAGSKVMEKCKHMTKNNSSSRHINKSNVRNANGEKGIPKEQQISNRSHALFCICDRRNSQQQPP